MAPAPDELTQASLERILANIAPDSPPVAFYPNAVRYYWKDNRLNWELVKLDRASEVFKGQADTFASTVKEVTTPPKWRIVIIRKRDNRRHFVHTTFTSRFWWEEGNGACDCNRRLAFEQVADPEFCERVECNVGENEYDIELPEDMK